MDTMKTLNILPEQLQNAMQEVMEDKALFELKALDWFTWNTDYFIEENNKKVA
jgi:hypothetical protein